MSLFPSKLPVAQFRNEQIQNKDALNTNLIEIKIKNSILLKQD